MDFVVIGVLTVALVFSVFLNITGGPEVVEELEPLSVLIADFENEADYQTYVGHPDHVALLEDLTGPILSSFRTAQFEIAG